MPIGAKMYEAANKEKTETSDAESDKSTDEPKKNDSDEPIEGEVVDKEK